MTERVGVRLSHADLCRLARSFLQSYPDANQPFREWALAADVLDVLLGKPWCAKHLLIGAAAKGKGGRHLGEMGELPEERVSHIGRVRELAELLYNLQSVVGMAARCQSIRSEDRDIRSVVFELVVGANLFRRGVHFEYQDVGYDIDIVSSNDIRVPGEIKLKFEETECREETVENSLTQARRQLPKGQVGVVFLGLPEIWGRSPESLLTVKSAIMKSLRSSSRIGKVLYFWDTSYLSASGGIVVRQFSRLSRQPPGLPVDVDHALETLEARPDLGWTTLISILDATA
jgi:hypothetical protein